jgi:hypothetical protein
MSGGGVSGDRHRSFPSALACIIGVSPTRRRLAFRGTPDPWRYGCIPKVQRNRSHSYLLSRATGVQQFKFVDPAEQFPDQPAVQRSDRFVERNRVRGRVEVAPTRGLSS